MMSTKEQKVCAPVYLVTSRFNHHAKASGYDQLGNYVGEAVALTDSMTRMANTVLRLPSKLAEKMAAGSLYRRRDAVLESVVATHMLRRQRSIYHVLYGEKNYRYLGVMNGKKGHRLIATFHHLPRQFPEMYKTTDPLKKLSHAVTVSTIQVDYLESILGKGKVTFVPYGVDVEAFKPAEERMDRPLRCVFVGYNMRDFEALSAIVQGILNQNKTVEFHMISRNKTCESIAAHERAFWHPYVSDDAYLNLLQQCDLLVLPLTGSTTVTAVLEALACGLPVLTHEGGIADYLDEDCGKMFAAGEVDGMVEEACAWLSNEALLKRMSQAARQRALTFRWKKVGLQMSSLYKRLTLEMMSRD